MDNAERQLLIKINGDWNTLFDSPARDQLETEALPRFLPSRRWFAGKARQIAATRVVEACELSASPHRIFLAFVEVAFTTGPRELYFVPLAIRPAESDTQTPPNNCLTGLISAEGGAWLIDAATEPDFAQALLAGIADSEQIPATHGVIQASGTTAFDALRGDSSEPLTPRPGPASSSNSLVFLGERLLLKLFRRLEAGVNPDLEVGRFLTEQTNFTRLPQVAGSLEYHPRDQSPPTTLAIMQQYIPHQGDGWTHALDELRRYYERVLAFSTLPAEDAGANFISLARQSCPGEIAEFMEESLDSAAVLGKRTAQMHAALASRDDISEFAPQPLTAEDMDKWSKSLREQAARAFSELQDHRDRLPPSQRPCLDWLLREGKARLESAISAGRQSPPEASKTRIHGDFHLGQVVRVQEDYVLLDFEGEPARSIAFRREKYSPIRDVAGMLRSFHYAAFAGAFALAESRGSELPRLASWAELWQRHVGAAFLREYLLVSGEESFIPEIDDELARLLDGFMLEKAFYELIYELNNRPEWARIPLEGLVALLGGPSRFETASNQETSQ